LFQALAMVRDSLRTKTVLTNVFLRTAAADGRPTVLVSLCASDVFSLLLSQGPADAIFNTSLLLSVKRDDVIVL
jgi:hypothetical protein